MTADILADWSNYVIVSDTPWSDGVRLVIGVVAAMVAVLLGRLYVGHRTGRMNRYAAFGAIGTYLAVGWAQIIAISGPSNDITAFNVVLLAVLAVSLYGTLRVMEVRLFTGEDERREGTE